MASGECAAKLAERSPASTRSGRRTLKSRCSASQPYAARPGLPQRVSKSMRRLARRAGPEQRRPGPRRLLATLRRPRCADVVARYIRRGTCPRLYDVPFNATNKHALCVVHPPSNEAPAALWRALQLYQQACPLCGASAIERSARGSMKRPSTLPTSMPSVWCIRHRTKRPRLYEAPFHSTNKHALCVVHPPSNEAPALRRWLLFNAPGGFAKDVLARMPIWQCGVRNVCH